METRPALQPQHTEVILFFNELIKILNQYLRDKKDTVRQNKYNRKNTISKLAELVFSFTETEIKINQILSEKNLTTNSIQNYPVIKKIKEITPNALEKCFKDISDELSAIKFGKKSKSTLKNDIQNLLPNLRKIIDDLKLTIVLHNLMAFTPKDIWHQIFSYLTKKEIAHVSSVCTFFKTNINSDSFLWQRLTKENFPQEMLKSNSKAKENFLRLFRDMITAKFTPKCYMIARSNSNQYDPLQCLNLFLQNRFVNLGLYETKVELNRACNGELTYSEKHLHYIIGFNIPKNNVEELVKTKSIDQLSAAMILIYQRVMKEVDKDKANIVNVEFKNGEFILTYRDNPNISVVNKFNGF